MEFVFIHYHSHNGDRPLCKIAPEKEIQDNTHLHNHLIIKSFNLIKSDLGVINQLKHQ